MVRLALGPRNLKEVRPCGVVTVATGLYLSGLIGDLSSQIYPPVKFHDNILAPLSGSEVVLAINPLGALSLQ